MNNHTNETTYAAEQNRNSKKWRVVKRQGSSLWRLKGAFATEAEAEAKAAALRKGGAASRGETVPAPSERAPRRRNARVGLRARSLVVPVAHRRQLHRPGGGGGHVRAALARRALAVAARVRKRNRAELLTQMLACGILQV